MRKEKGLHPELSLGEDSFELLTTQGVKFRGLAICAGVEITPEAGQKYKGLFILTLIKRSGSGIDRHK